MNSINPGLVETPGTHEGGYMKKRQDYEAQTLLGRIGQPQDIAPAAVFLASNDSSWMTGEAQAVEVTQVYCTKRDIATFCS